jgi:hypothetical protein
MPTRRSLRHEFQSCAALPFKVQHSSLIRSQIASLLSGLGLTKSAALHHRYGCHKPQRAPVGPNGWLRISLAVARSRRTCSLARPAVLTVLRAWHMAGTTIGVTPMGSFEEWSYRVRQPLLWLDRDDPCDSIATVRENDPSRDALLAVLLEWKRALGIRNSHTVQQIIARALTNMDFFSALMGVATNPAGNLSATYAGLLAASGRGQDLNKYRLVKDKGTGGYPHWALTET